MAFMPLVQGIAELEFQALLEYLAEMPAVVRELSRNLAQEELKRKRSENQFSFLENVCHLRDIEQEGYTVRISKLLNEKEPVLPDIDGASLARERNYNSQDFATALNEFTNLREKNVNELKSLLPESLNFRGMFEGWGVVTLKHVAGMMYKHDKEHRAELSSLREWLTKIEATDL